MMVLEVQDIHDYVPHCFMSHHNGCIFSLLLCVYIDVEFWWVLREVCLPLLYTVSV